MQRGGSWDNTDLVGKKGNGGWMRAGSGKMTVRPLDYDANTAANTATAITAPTITAATITAATVTTITTGFQRRQGEDDEA